MKTIYHLTYFEIDEGESGSVAEQEAYTFNSWDEAIEEAEKLDIADIDLEKGIGIAEISLDDEGNAELLQALFRAVFEDGKIVDWVKWISQNNYQLSIF
jgi:hypothetical protein